MTPEWDNILLSDTKFESFAVELVEQTLAGSFISWVRLKIFKKKMSKTQKKE